MSTDSLQKYMWTMTGMRPTEMEHGAMPYYRMADVEDLIRKLEKQPPLVRTGTSQPLLDEEVGNLRAKLKYVIKAYHLVAPLEDSVFTFPDGDSWSPEDSA